MGRIVILDVSAYLFRAYHALPPMTTPDGAPVNAIYGCTNMFLRVAKRFEHFRAVAALDSGRDTVRRERYPAYKANRKEIDEDLRSQFVHIPAMLEALGLAAIAIPGYEADDIVAAIRSAYPEDEIIVISSDKDLAQLVNSRTFLYDGVKDRIIDAAAVAEKFGVPPEKMRDFLALTGDSSDNVPGVPGIGPKTAAKLLADFRDIDDMYARPDALVPKLREKLMANREQLLLSRELVTLIADLPLPSLPAEEWRGPDIGKFREFIGRLGFRSFERYLVPGAFGSEEKPRRSEPAVIPAEVSAVAPVVASTEREAYLFRHEGRLYISSEGMIRPATPEEVVPAVHWYGFDLKGTLPPEIGEEVRLTDLQIAYFILDSGRHGYEMTEVAGYLGIVGPSDLAPEALAKMLSDLRGKIMPEIEGDPRRRVLLYDIEMPHLMVVRDMERYGIAVDRERLEALRREYVERLTEIEKTAHVWAGGPVNLNSPKQLAQVLFEKLGLPPARKTKSGPSTDSDVLEELKPLHPLPALILEHRTYQKLLSTYLDPIAQKVSPDGRLRSSFILTHAATGRLASRDPNLQNIPVRTEEGRRIRSLFPAAPGCRFLSLDYNQIELRVLAALSGDEELRGAFQRGEDIHRRTASVIFGVFPEFVDETMRRHAKAVNFGIVYGMQAFKLAQDTGVEMKFAKEYIDQYFRFYTGVKRFIDETVARARETGWVETMHGRRRAVPELAATNKNIARSGERIAVNTVIQGTAAEIMKLGAVKVRRALKKAGIPARILLAIHDELVLEVPADRAEETAQIAAEAMRTVLPDFPVPLEVSVSSGARWDELE